MPSIACLLTIWSLVSVWDIRVYRHVAAATIEPSSSSYSTTTTTTAAAAAKKPCCTWNRLVSTTTPSQSNDQEFLAFLPLAWRGGGGGGGGGSYMGHEEEENDQGNNEKYWRREHERDYENAKTLMKNVRDDDEIVQEEEQEVPCSRGEDDDILDSEEEELVHLLEEEEKEESSATLLPEQVSAYEQASSETEMHDFSLEKVETTATPRRRTATKRRKTFDMNVNLITRSGVDGNAESIALRTLIMQRRDEHLRHLLPSFTHQQQQHQYVEDEQDVDGQSNVVSKEEKDGNWEKHYHPKRLLHFIAPKIPAIKHSRDVALRIQSARSDVDAGVAACLIGTLAHVCEVYSNKVAAAVAAGDNIIVTDESSESLSKKKHAKSASVARDLIQDRRFEQLMECILCGLDVRRRKREYLRMQLEERRLRRIEQEDENDNDGDGKTGSLHHEEDAMDDEASMLLQEDFKVDEGLSIRDACRAAWGLAILGVFPTQTISDTNVSDILLALSLRIRELLLVRIQALRQDDLFDDNRENDERRLDNSEQIIPNVDLTTAGMKRITIEERIMIIAEEIAEDAVTAMWTFACVRAACGDILVDVDGSSFTAPLMKVCIFLLCHDPIQLRRQAQEEVVDQSVGKDTGLALLQRHRATGILQCRNTQHVIGSNDVVERLARAEEAEKEDEQYGVTTTVLENQAALERQENSENEISPKHALLDWLSPSEITDVVWSLATNGNSDGSTMPSSREEQGLSEAASVLCSIAFDRLHTYVRQDFETVQEAANELRKRKLVGDTTRPVHEHYESSSKVDGPLEPTMEEALTECTVNDASPMSGEEKVSVVVECITIKTAKEGRIGAEEVVHVVDAASLLASEAQKSGVIRGGIELEQGPPSHPHPSFLQDDEMVESLTITTPDKGDEGEDAVNVDDAASLLASEEAEQGTGPILKSIGQALATDIDEHKIFITKEEILLNTQGQLLFSMHDLCAMTWAATELRDSLRPSITTVVSQIIVELGKSSLEGCSGADLSNLAWALAKCSTEGTQPIPEGRVVAAWIAEHVYKEGGAIQDSVAERARCIQTKFQPRQLSRLLWSIACSLSDNGEFSKDLETPGKLALAGLLAAANNLHFYRTEDFVRIAWAFLELNDLDVVRSEHPGAIVALGGIIASIELSLTNWESGDPPLSPQGSTEGIKEHYRFMSFFGKTRGHAALLRQKLEEGIDDNNVEDFPGSSLLHSERKIPLLKNLPVDPASLCKLVHSCSRASTTITGIKGWDALARVALRLMTSRHGRLLRECHSRDLACLCEAATLMVSTSSRELVGLFARRVVAILNDSPDLLVHAPPQVHADLLMSLGVLGVKHHPKATTPLPYRRLQLTILDPFIGVKDLNQLPNPVYMSLIQGLVSLSAVSSDPDYIVVVLQSAIDRLPSLLQEASICDLAEALGALHEGAKVVTAMATKNSTGAELNEEEPPVNAAHMVQSMSRDLLSQLADAMIQRVGELTTVNLRRLMQVYAMHRLQADILVEAIEEEMERRREHLLLVPHPETERITLDDALWHVAANAAFIKRSLSGEEKEESGNVASPFTTLRKGLQSIFGRAKPKKTPPSYSSSKVHQESEKNDSDNVRDDNDNEPAVENAPNSEDDSQVVKSEEDRHEQDTLRLEEIEQSLDALVEAVFVAQDLAALAAKNDHDETIVQDLFELGRCDELIANYRHWDFESGALKSRGFDSSGEGRRRDMAKRVLSQLLP